MGSQNSQTPTIPSNTDKTGSLSGGGGGWGTSKRLTINGFLFDMDGTIIDSTAAIVKHWHLIGEELGFDPNVVLETSHGRRSIDTLQVLDPGKANWDYVHRIEARIPAEFGQDAREIPGARDILDRLTELGVPWAIVTSGTAPLVHGWLKVMDLPPPPVLVTAEDVSQGKPDPACYNLGKERIGLDRGNASILVVEDAPSGIRAGKAAGCTVLGLATTHSIDNVIQAGADVVVKDLDSLKILEIRKIGGGMVEADIELFNIWTTDV